MIINQTLGFIFIHIPKTAGTTLKGYFVHENESIYVPETTKHRLINHGKIPLEIIEVQVGEYI